MKLYKTENAVDGYVQILIDNINNLDEGIISLP